MYPFNMEKAPIAEHFSISFTPQKIWEFERPEIHWLTLDGLGKAAEKHYG